MNCACSPRNRLNLANIWDDYYSQSGTEEEKKKAKYSAVLCYGRAVSEELNLPIGVL